MQKHASQRRRSTQANRTAALACPACIRRSPPPALLCLRVAEESATPLEVNCGTLFSPQASVCIPCCLYAWPRIVDPDIIDVSYAISSTSDISMQRVSADSSCCVRKLSCLLEGASSTSARSQTEPSYNQEESRIRSSCWKGSPSREKVDQSSGCMPNRKGAGCA